MVIAITREPIDPYPIIESAKKKETGGIVTFIGTVRDDGIEALSLEVCEEVALADLKTIGAKAVSEYHLNSVDIVHRVGRMNLTEVIVVIVVGASHREEGFAACAWILEEIKTYVPIWKKDINQDGESWHFSEESKN
ncbi:molybdenum cofactor biosynthesis protein MoaE [Methanospirillum stamsii]|uniref:Molybdopterin biosynthesis protein MoeE n=1 Tax=Methanospirillum stamsii TaxID=1277351 RepID=A0A2V2NEE9_9EURY|nr:molybdenum cofactor biosynthesis protein MoaE [Methanospirillum stamsii]PWR74798.1 molybdopterin biosynthesis protein MoeE [Methanospirillum stamsii]